MKSALTAILTIAFVSTLLGAGTLAYFSDTETSIGNTLTAGTMDLKVMDVNEGWKDGVTATWTLSNMKPGDTKTGWVGLDKVGSIEADHVGIACNYIVTEEFPQTESDTDPNTNEHPDWMAKNMTIMSAWYYGDGYNINLLTGIDIPSAVQHDYWMIEDKDGDGRRTLYDLKNDPLDNLPQPNTFNYFFSMGLRFDYNAGNDFQGDTFDLTMYFTLNQEASQ